MAKEKEILRKSGNMLVEEQHSTGCDQGNCIVHRRLWRRMIANVAAQDVMHLYCKPMRKL